MKETILYISKSEQDIQKFLYYIQRRVEKNRKNYTHFTDKHEDVLKTENFDIIGKSVYGNRLGAGYGYCLYYCFSSNFDKNKYNEMENKKIEQILMHTREGAREISELDILYMLGLV